MHPGNDPRTGRIRIGFLKHLEDFLWGLQDRFPHQFHRKDRILSELFHHLLRVEIHLLEGLLTIQVLTSCKGRCSWIDRS